MFKSNESWNKKGNDEPAHRKLWEAAKLFRLWLIGIEANFRALFTADLENILGTRVRSLLISFEKNYDGLIILA